VSETRTLEPEISTADLADRPTRAIRDDLPEAQEAETGRTAPGPLFAQQETDELRRRWMEVQTRFVDDPRASVQEADGLVAQAMKRLAEIFADERARLEGQWSRGDEGGTEDLRQAIRRYRSFFDRLLSV